jgi:hypothetical protein
MAEQNERKIPEEAYGAAETFLRSLGSADPTGTVVKIEVEGVPYEVAIRRSAEPSYATNAELPPEIPDRLWYPAG